MRRAGAKPLLAGIVIALTQAAAGQSRESMPLWWDLPFKALTQPSESMLPTIRPVSYLIARKRPAAALHRGDVIVFRKGGEEIWVKRVIGLPGDRVAMAAGLVSVNGQTAAYGKPEPYTGVTGPAGRLAGPAMRRAERLPGETAPHFVLDMGRLSQEDSPSSVVARNRVYVLGDNRDNSVDSRFAADAAIGGLGQVAFDDIYGVVDQSSIQWLRRPQ